jgi:predicted acyl esterase
MKRLLTVAACLAALAIAPAAAQAEVTSAFGGKVPCTTDAQGLRVCQGDSSHLVPSWDGTTIDVNLVLPAANGKDGGYPLIGFYHGWGGSKIGTGTLKEWARRGYAAFSMSDRGWGDSCGGTSQTRLLPTCLKGYNHLLDTRYEVRDAQYLISLLADQDSGSTTLVDGQRIGATGGSYGGGMSMALAALKDRIMLPDGHLTAWTSPAGRPMRIAAAAPEIPWTDLAYALTPNGRNLDYVTDNSYGTRLGVPKASFVSGLYALGAASSNYAPPGYDADADLTKWYGITMKGETSDNDPLFLDVLDELRSHHSSYYIDSSEAPAPLLISNGWTDDLFPPDEAIRFYNRTRAAWPGTPISLFFLDYGHQRGQNKGADTAVLHARQRDWFDHYLNGGNNGTSEPLSGVETLTQTCPKSAASAGPFTAPTWADLARGEVRFGDAAQQVVASGGDPRAGQAFDPIAGGGACATAPAADAPGTADYHLPAATGDGYTLMGFPTVIAKIVSPGPNNQLAARLLDVGPDGNETLVARGLYRPDVTTDATRQVFQLHANGWRFAAGHTPKLELLTSDAPYGRPSNGQTPMLVSDLQLRLPVLEQPADGGPVSTPAAKVLPAGARLTADFARAQRARAKRAG